MPLAIPVALGIVMVVYAVVLGTALLAVGPNVADQVMVPHGIDRDADLDGSTPPSDNDGRGGGTVGEPRPS